MPASAAAIGVGAPQLYLKTHGAKVARRHMVDWIVLVLLAAVAVALSIIEPFHRFVSKDMMVDLLYPLKDNTVPIWAVAVLAGVVPVLIFTGVYMRRRNAYDLHHAILGLLFSVLITGVITEAIKNGVGRPRPDFYWRCFPDGVPDKSSATETPASSKKGTRASRVATPHGPSLGWAFCRGTWLARSGRSTGVGTSPSSASSSCRCSSQRWSACRGWTTTGTTGRTCSPLEFWVWWLLHFATCSSSRLPRVKMDIGPMHSIITFSIQKPRTKHNQ